MERRGLCRLPHQPPRRDPARPHHALQSFARKPRNPIPLGAGLRFSPSQAAGRRLLSPFPRSPRRQNAKSGVASPPAHSDPRKIELSRHSNRLPPSNFGPRNASFGYLLSTPSSFRIIKVARRRGLGLL